MSKSLGIKKPTARRETAVTPVPDEAKVTRAEILQMDTSNVTSAPTSPHDQSRFNAIRARTIQQIFAQQLTVDVPVSLIEDEVGSDRSDVWKDDEDLDALTRNIEQEGQATPVALRVLDEDWVPSGRDVRDIGEKEDVRFTVQAGRRRIEACRRLNRKVRAFISHGDPYADLKVRFFENTQRKDLCPLDYLRSIGQLASEMRERTPGISNIKIGEHLGVHRTNITRGDRAIQYAEELSEMYPDDGGRFATHEELRRVLSEIFEAQNKNSTAKAAPSETAVTPSETGASGHDDFEIGRNEADTPKSRQRKFPYQKKIRLPGYSLELNTIRSGADFKLRGGKIKPETMDRIAEAVETIMREDEDS